MAACGCIHRLHARYALPGAHTLDPCERAVASMSLAGAAKLASHLLVMLRTPPLSAQGLLMVRLEDSQRLDGSNRLFANDRHGNMHMMI